MTIIGVLVTVILLNEFPGSKISKKVILNKISKVIQNANIEIKLILYSSWFLYLLFYYSIFFITRSQFKSYKYCHFFSRIPILGKGLNLTFSLIRSAILEEKYNARDI